MEKKGASRVHFSLSSHQDVFEVKCEPVDGPVPPQGELGILTVNALRRSVSQVLNRKSLARNDEANVSGHDSGMVRDPKNVCWACSDSLTTYRFT